MNITLNYQHSTQIRFGKQSNLFGKFKKINELQDKGKIQHDMPLTRIMQYYSQK